MDIAIAIIRLLLVGVFTVAGLAKLADLAGSRAAVAGFGVPERVAYPLGTLLPLAELTAAGLLLFGTTARAGSGVALALLCGFSAGIARSIARGESPDCHCFGQLHSEPAGPRTLIRNLSLAGLAAIATFASGATGPGLEDVSGTAGVAIAAALAALLLVGLAALAFLEMLRWRGRLLLRVEALEAALRARGIPIPAPAAAQPQPPGGLPVGSPAPDFSLPALDGETVSLASLREAGRPLLLMFTDPKCGPCRQLLPRVGGWQRERSDGVTIALVSRGDAEEIRAETSEHGVERVLNEADLEVSNAYRAQATPSAVLVGADGRIASPLASGDLAIVALVERATASLEVTRVPASPAGRGDPLPEADGFTDLEGQPAELSSALEGDDHVLVFWDPGCGFCQRMLPDLLALERDEPETARPLVFVSRGDREANRRQRLAAPVLLEDRFALGQAVGAGGTPSAIRLDSEGRIASEVAVGAEAILSLLRSDSPVT